MPVYQSLLRHRNKPDINYEEKPASSNACEYHVVHSLKATRFILLLIAFICFIIGGVIHYHVQQSVYCEYQYSYNDGKELLISFDPEKCRSGVLYDPAGKPFIPAPFTIGYKLKHFYFNHRSFLNSVRWEKERDTLVMLNTRTSRFCIPVVHDPQGNLIIPCGLAAKHAFNDSFQLLRGDDQSPVPQHESYTDIVDSTGATPQYATVGSQSLYETGFGRLIDHESFPEGARDPHFLVWMKRVINSSFLKPYAVIRESVSLPFYVRVQNRYDLSRSRAKKSVVIYRPTAYGTYGLKDAIAFYIVASLYMVAFIVMYLGQLYSPRQRGDIRFLTRQH